MTVICGEAGVVPDEVPVSHAESLVIVKERPAFVEVRLRFCAAGVASPLAALKVSDAGLMVS